MKRALFLFVLGACNSPAPAPTKAADAPPALAPAKAEPRQFGAAFTLGAAEPLAQAIARVAQDGATAKGEEHACDGDKAKSGGDKPVESCGAANADAQGPKVRVKGTVASVCQKAGCWMVLQDGVTEARIFMREHRFFLPKDIAGKSAEVEGTLRAKTVSPQFAKHLAADAAGTPRTPGAGKSPPEGAGEQKEYMMSATAVAISD